MRDWLIVSGGVRRAGGQDRANLELARYLAHSGGHRLTIVANRIDPEVTSFANTSVHLVRPPLGSNMLGEILLRWKASSVAARLPRPTVVLANGGNYPPAQVNWVHCVHAAWDPRDEGAPVQHRVLARVKKRSARRAERAAVEAARVLIANSEKTATDLHERLGVPWDRIRVVHFGADPAPVNQKPGHQFRIGFVGALGWDRNKGLDTGIGAFALATRHLDPRYRLVVAGAGGISPWQREARRLGVEHRVDFVGFVGDIGALLRSVDVVLSPVRYEAYGLAVQDALVAGTPVLVSADAGIAQRLTGTRFLVEAKEDPWAWAAKLLELSRNLDQARREAVAIGKQLGSRSWEQMARELVGSVEHLLGAASEPSTFISGLPSPTLMRGTHDRTR